MKSKGFTLIELLVVIAIIAILAVVVLLALNSARVKARDAKAISDLRSLSPAMELCLDDTTGIYPSGNYAGLSAFDCGANNFSVYVTPPTPTDTGHTYTYCSTAGTAYCLETQCLSGSCPSGNPQIIGTDACGSCS